MNKENFAKMGSFQSRNNTKLKLKDSNIRIIITESNQSDDEEEFFDCSSDMMSSESLTFIEPCHDDSIERDESSDKNNFNNKETCTDSGDSSCERKVRLQRELTHFREDINKKRVLRQQCLKNLRDELKDLREKLSHQISINEKLNAKFSNCITIDDSKEVKTENRHLKTELSECNMLLQKLNGEHLNVSIENKALRDHVKSLKEVNKAMKEMLSIRELQVDQLKLKLEEIESSLTDRETKMLSKNLRQEYERQLENIRSMRSLYEERNNLLLQENNMLKQQISDKEHDLEIQKEK